jgi:hypothetical protein
LARHSQNNEGIRALAGAAVLEPGLEAPIHQEHAENEQAIQAAVVDELSHGFDWVQLRVDDSFHIQAHSQ